MARRRKRKRQTKLTARQKAQLSSLLAIVRKFPRKKKVSPPSAIGGGGASGSTCQALAADIIQKSAELKQIVNRGIATTAQYNFFAQKQALLQAALANFATQGCSQSLIVGKI